MNDEKSKQFLPDLTGSYAALKRAAERAKRLAEQTGTELITTSRSATQKVASDPSSSKSNP